MATFPCGVNDNQIYSSVVPHEAKTLIVSEISTNDGKIIMGFTNLDDSRIFLPCNFPKELINQIEKRVQAKYKIFTFENLNVRENPVELVSYKIL